MRNAAFTHDVFLSHSAKDKAVVRGLAERLRKDGLKVWFDEWECPSPAGAGEGARRAGGGSSIGQPDQRATSPVGLRMLDPAISRVRTLGFTTRPRWAEYPAASSET